MKVVLDDNQKIEAKVENVPLENFIFKFLGSALHGQPFQHKHREEDTKDCNYDLDYLHYSLLKGNVEACTLGIEDYVDPKHEEEGCCSKKIVHFGS